MRLRRTNFSLTENHHSHPDGQLKDVSLNEGNFVFHRSAAAKVANHTTQHHPIGLSAPISTHPNPTLYPPSVPPPLVVLLHFPTPLMVNLKEDLIER